MKEIFEEYGGIIVIAIVGFLVVLGFSEALIYMKKLGVI